MMKVEAWEDNEGNLHRTETAMHMANKQREIAAYMRNPGCEFWYEDVCTVSSDDLCKWLATNAKCAKAVSEYIQLVLKQSNEGDKS